jgi:threonine dehydrogenase-like Zn-dependent dehydrogenase
MIGAFLIKPGSVEIKKIDTPEPHLGEVRVRLQKTGICGSDVHLFLGHRLLKYPVIIGHEGLGIVDKTGEGVTSLKPGDRVVIEPNIPCRQCSFCMSGRGNICINKRVIGLTEQGCFAEFVSLPHQFCWQIPDDISEEDGVTIEPAAVAYHALFSSRSRPGDAIAVIGLGAIGLLVTHIAIGLGYKVLATDINESKLRLATAMGALPVTANENPEETVSKLSGACIEYQVNALFECGGSEITASLATAIAPRGSEIILIGLSENSATFQPLKIVREDIRIIPSIIYDHPADFKRTIQLIESKIIQPGKIISGSYHLSQLQTALEAAASGNESKLIVTI